MTPNSTDPDAIKAAVRDYYSKVARQESSGSCCGAGNAACCADAGAEGSRPYSAAELAGVPAAAATSSRGCGNPTALATLRPGEVVLDLGSGGGLDVLLAAQRVGPAGFAYGLDMTDEMLALARRNAEKTGVTNVAFLKGELEAIPLPNASVDVVISNCVINLTPDKGRALREAFRVLRPGGRLAVSDIVVEGGLARLPIGEAQIRAALSWAGCLGGALTADQYRTVLAEAGFEAIAVDVEHRYTLADMPPSLPSSLARLAPSLLQQVVSRFTSSAITARRP